MNLAEPEKDESSVDKLKGALIAWDSVLHLILTKTPIDGIRTIALQQKKALHELIRKKQKKEKR